MTVILYPVLPGFVREGMIDDGKKVIDALRWNPKSIKIRASQMPFKTKLKMPSRNPKKKPSYKVINWAQYNKSLKKTERIKPLFSLW